MTSPLADALKVKSFKFSLAPNICLALGLVLSLFTGANSANAAWIASGGDLVGDEFNPWFVQNTKVVSACVLTDGNVFRDPEALQQSVLKAWEFWRHDFEYANAMGVIYVDPTGKYFNGDVKVATQPLVFSECTPETQIRFQFGTLNSAQAAFFQQNPSILARSVRTVYSPETLQAQGFLYISPQVGELVNSTGGLSGELILQHFLTHELGHVFGIKHLDQQDDNLMSTEHLSSLFKKLKYGNVKYTLSPEPIFEYQNATSNLRGGSVCEDVAWGRPDILKVLDPSGDLRCLGFPKTKFDAKSFLMHGRSPEDTGDRVVGKMTVGNELNTTENTLVGVHVTAAAEQVYPGLKAFLGNWPSLRLRGGVLRTKGWEAVYTDNANQVSKPVIVIANRNQSVLVIGALEGKPVSNLELYSSATVPKKTRQK